MTPVELSGGTRFPEIGERPYFLNLGPFAFYWFALERQHAGDVKTVEEVPLIGAKKWDEVFADRNRDALLDRASSKRIRDRGAGSAAKRGRSVVMSVRELVPLPKRSAYLAIRHIDYADGEPETYLLPLGITQARRADEQETARTPMLIARLRDGFFLYEPLVDAKFDAALLDTIARRRTLKADRGTVTGTPTQAFRGLRGTGQLKPHVLKTEQSDTVRLFGERFLMKLFRRLEPGINTDLEMMRFLNEETAFSGAPRLAGSLQYEAEGGGEPTTLAILESYVANSGDAWSYTLDSIGRFFESVLSDSGARERLIEGPRRRSRC